MKNVAKCDTWCELQNPVNHRVFERKLRPKPLGRGHVCLGVTHRCPPHPHTPSRGTVGRAENGLPCAPARGWSKYESFGDRAATIGGGKCLSSSRRSLVSPWQWLADPCKRLLLETVLVLRPQVRRDYPLSLSISISGGKETYQDSPSNGERTGKSPA